MFPPLPIEIGFLTGGFSGKVTASNQTLLLYQFPFDHVLRKGGAAQF